MMLFILKALVSGLIVAIVADVSKRSPTFGALIVSLPLVSLLAMIWLWRETGDPVRLADHAEATFWYVLPSLPMFLLIPAMLRNGAGFWVSLAAGCAMTVAFYGIMLWLGPRFGLKL